MIAFYYTAYLDLDMVLGKPFDWKFSDVNNSDLIGFSEHGQ